LLMMMVRYSCLNLFLILLFCIYSEEPTMTTDELIVAINSQDSGWTAATTRASAFTNDQLKLMLGAAPQEEAVGGHFISKNDQELIKKLPKNFDSRENWPKCTSIGLPRDQGPCGGCWAMSTVSMLADRMCIQSNGAFSNLLSYYDTMTCTGGGNGCHGGSDAAAQNYLISQGTVIGGRAEDQKGCRPTMYKHCNHHQMGGYGICPPTGETPECDRKCSGTETKDKYDQTPRYKAKSFHHVSGEYEMMKEVMENGPVTVSFSVYRDFYYYLKGVYKHVAGDFIGVHSVRLIGWGEENDLKYWIVTNSWNDDWGENGIVRYRRGDNHGGIEGKAIGAKPDLSNVEMDSENQNEVKLSTTVDGLNMYSTLLFILLGLNISLFGVFIYIRKNKSNTMLWGEDYTQLE